MSAYNPPSQNQSIFNPNNYGTAISTLADSAYDEITATLGNFTTLFIGTDNVATALNGKQELLTAGVGVDITNNVLSLSLHQYQGIPQQTIDITTITGITGNTLYGSNKYNGGVLAPNGKIYGIPRDADSVLIIDPKTNTASYITGMEVLTGKYNGGVLAPNGKIYCIPSARPNVLVIDPITNTTTTISGVASGSNKYYGGVLAPNGKIYAIPFSQTAVLIIDPETASVNINTITGITGNSKYAGGVLAPNGKIYGIPYNATNVLIIDPVANTADTTTIASGLTGSLKYNGGVLAPNGKIYGIPYTANNVLIIDPVANTIDTTNAENILVIDTETNTTTTITGLTSDTTKYFGGVLAPNGIIYGIPASSTEVLQVKTGLPKYPNYMLQAYFNKY